jgi:hypothetical protein
MAGGTRAFRDPASDHCSQMLIAPEEHPSLFPLFLEQCFQWAIKTMGDFHRLERAIRTGRGEPLQMATWPPLQEMAFSHHQPLLPGFLGTGERFPHSRALTVFLICQTEAKIQLLICERN